jgi:cytochrome c oxidase subunit 3
MHATAHEAASHEEPHDPAEHLSAWPPIISLGVLLLYFGVIFGGPVLGAGIVLFLAALYGWVTQDYAHWKKAPHGGHAEEGHLLPRARDAEAGRFANWVQRAVARPTAWWGIMLFLLTEIMLFGALFALYFISKAQYNPFPPEGAPELPVVATGINTAILVSSGVTMHLGIMALRKDNRTWFLAMFALTIVLGLAFLYNQVTEYLELFHEGFNLDSGVYGAAFFSLTGVHGAHVTAGLAGLVAVFGRGLGGQFNSKRHMGVEAVAIYWHFVDFVWIFLYVIIYVRIIG